MQFDVRSIKEYIYCNQLNVAIYWQEIMTLHIYNFTYYIGYIYKLNYIHIYMCICVCIFFIL